MLEHRIKVVKNPYPHTIPNDTFVSMLLDICGSRAADIERRYLNKEYKRDSMGFVLLDPTAPNSTRSENAVVAYFSIGSEGDSFLVNAIAKAFEHRDHCASAGSLLFSQTHRLADGDFRWGHSAYVEGTIVGASAQTPEQDRYQAQLLAVEVNYGVGSIRGLWTELHTGGDWFCNDNAPGERYANALAGVADQPWIPATT